LFSDKYKTHKYSVGRACSCWMLNWWCITWPISFKWSTYVLSVIMLIELLTALILETNGCIASLPQVCPNEPYLKLWVLFSYMFIALEINTLYRNVCILYIPYIYNLQVSMFTSGIDIHYTGWGFQSPKPPGHIMF
jgi:hypothetical protein